jgi:hypothetical protein
MHASFKEQVRQTSHSTYIRKTVDESELEVAGGRGIGVTQPDWRLAIICTPADVGASRPYTITHALVRSGLWEGKCGHPWKMIEERREERGLFGREVVSGGVCLGRRAVDGVYGEVGVCGAAAWKIKARQLKKGGNGNGGGYSYPCRHAGQALRASRTWLQYS